VLSQKLRNLATALLLRPELAASVAAHLDELADCAAALEQASVPPHLLAAAGILPIDGDNVVRLERRAVRA
jgi:hypothetical protein